MEKKEENCDIVNKYFYYDIIIVVLYYYSLLFIEHLNEKKVCFKLKLSVIFWQIKDLAIWWHK